MAAANVGDPTETAAERCPVGLRETGARPDEVIMVRFALRWWAPFVVPTAAALAILALGATHDHSSGSQGLAFGVVLALTALCAAFALIVLALGACLPDLATFSRRPRRPRPTIA